MRYYEHDMNGWGYVGMGLGMVLLVALAVAGGILFIRLAARDLDRGSMLEPPTAEGVLARRFAAGEIDDDEYNRKLAVLRAAARTAR